MKQPRPYQVETIAKARALFKAGRRRVVVVAPTGAGKTYMGALMGYAAVKSARRVLWLAHRDDLVGGAYETLQREGVLDVGVISAARRDLARPAPFQIASIQTLLARGEMPDADVIVPDECHHFGGTTTWRRLVAERYPKAHVIGLTATPERGDGKPLDIFEDLVVAASVKQLQALGFLVKCWTYGPEDNLKSNLAQDPLDCFLESGDHESETLVFARDRAHGIDLERRWVAAGHYAKYVDGETPMNERRRVLELFNAGRLRTVINVNLFTEGTDVPRIRRVILGRAFGTVGSYIQAGGRGLRPSPETGKTHLDLYDLCGAAHLHKGTVEADRSYSLEGKAIRASNPLDPVKRCPVCRATQDGGSVCERCGHAFADDKVAGARAEPDITGDEVKLLDDAELARRAKEKAELQEFNRLRRLYSHDERVRLADQLRPRFGERRVAR